MKLIQPNCRIQFTGQDIDFIIHVLGRKHEDRGTLIQLLTDDEARDLILDDERLLMAILEQNGCVRVSQHLYFYILVRQVFKRAGLEDREVADYVAEVMVEFSSSDHARFETAEGTSLDYFFEMMEALQRADDKTAFCLRAHIASKALFLSGVFPDQIRYRAERRGAPGLSYYEGLGRMNFHVAGHHRLAEKYQLSAVFQALSEHFDSTRQALNDMAQRMLWLGDADYSFLLVRKN